MVQTELWSILYQPPRGMVSFQKQMCRWRIRTCSTYMSSLFQDLSCVWCFLKNTRLYILVCLCVCVCTGHLADSITLSTCVLFPCGTKAQVRDVSFTLMCYQSVKLETRQPRQPSTYTRMQAHTHTDTHTHRIKATHTLTGRSILVL